jgi:hypothetical protein
MGTSKLEFSLTCGCGRTIIARAKDAGGSLACPCGGQMAVPKLSELRTMAGYHAYTTNPAEAIRRAQSQGIDPAGDSCVLCGSPTPVLYTCHAVCESSHVKKGASDANDFLKWLLLPLILNLLDLLRPKETQSDRQGHDVEVTFTLPVCDQCAATCGSVVRPAVAKRLMANVPMYRELLDFYPRMSLKVDRPVS